MRHIAVAALLAAVLIPAVPARAAMSRAELLAHWTQPTDAGFTAWNTARLDRDRWASYRFDWSTDLCTGAPEAPFGFDFSDACRRHDFGYRNYRDAGAFADHKTRLDEAFRVDLRRVCDARPLAAQPPCNAIAFTYHQAVKLLR
ncbi:phospholipase [Actinoplanes sp. NPDC049802]|uniref:phospholipase n=1 Tax=Actinoplanes sp. NPDC049802 TaxID=3154742 RepID=UPI0033F7AF90